jgi:hypothetical protein
MPSAEVLYAKVYAMAGTLSDPTGDVNERDFALEKSNENDNKLAT